MKIIISILISLFIALNCQAQTKPKFNIKIVSKDGHTTRGLLYAVGEKEIIVLKHEKDTIKINFNKMKHLYVKQKGIVLPLMLAGAGAFVVAAAEADMPLDQAAYLFVGVPVGIAVGNLVGQLFANKRFYRHIKVADFPAINVDLQKYTQVKVGIN